MSSTSILFITCASYACASLYAFFLTAKNRTLDKPSFLLCSLIAIGLHGLSVYQAMALSDGIDLSIYNMASLIALVINALVLTSSMKKPLHNLLLLLLPLSCIIVALNLGLQSRSPHFIAVTSGVAGHIVLSIVAYSVLAMTTLQALLWSWQNRQIKQHHLSGIAGLLPPLQTMELLMFEMLWTGVIFLGLAILCGFIFLDNIFDQQLVHKTVLSIFALVIFAALLWGRYQLGWRGNTAVKWILGGFCLLMLAYFGSKVVLELILA